MGLAAIAGLRRYVPGVRIVVGARYPHQMAFAKAIGADVVVQASKLDRAVRREAGCHMIGDQLSSGAHATIDAVGTGESITDCLRITRPRGRVVLLGMPSDVKLDLTGLWHRETELKGAYTYGTETLPDGSRRARSTSPSTPPTLPGRAPAVGHLPPRRPHRRHRPCRRRRPPRRHQDRLRPAPARASAWSTTEKDRLTCHVQVSCSRSTGRPRRSCSGAARGSASRSSPPTAAASSTRPSRCAGIDDLDGAIRNALLNPIDMEPLPALLHPDMKLTIVFDDASLSLPKMRRPDNRQRIIEAVLDLAAAAGVDDIHIIAALGLHRRMHEYELRHVLGDRIVDAFQPRGMLYQHDAEDHENLAVIGTTDEGEIVEINKRAADSDLIVYANVNQVAMDGGWKSITTGLASYRCLSHHHNPRVAAEHASSLMGHRDAQRAAQEHLADGQGAPRPAARRSSRSRPRSTPTRSRRRSTSSASASGNGRPKDRATYLATAKSLDRMPNRAKRKIFHGMEAPYATTSVQAGVHAVGARDHAQERLRPAPRRGAGPDRHPHDGHPVHLPVQPRGHHEPDPRDVHGARLPVQHVPDMPLVREGGVVIMTHPTYREFHPVHHPSYIDFFDEVLADTTDPAVMSAKWEKKYAEDEWYRHLYRTGNAYHGVHPFYAWYWGAHGQQYAGQVIIVGGDPASVRRLGFTPASTMDDAFEIASDVVGRSPTITHLHVPGVLVADVK